MISLNLPSYPIKLSGTREKPAIFDVLRRKYVALTPEEWVRQHFVHYLLEHKGYPASLLANEVPLRVGDKSLRADTVLYDRLLRPRMVIEYKAPSIRLSQQVLDQANHYNMLLHVGYMVISNGLEHHCYKLSDDRREYQLLPDIPDYKDL
ncbi:MAG: type I restriction enzyme HsdR N-terminal domain-containing protein [Prevotella sp.]|nr:type I restriction enzyme HsdR N-terminal domain-containing protein [Prevotella sp.]